MITTDELLHLVFEIDGLQEFCRRVGTVQVAEAEQMGDLDDFLVVYFEDVAACERFFDDFLGIPVLAQIDVEEFERAEGRHGFEKTQDS